MDDNRLPITQFTTEKLSLVIPVYNEERNLTRFIQILAGVSFPIPVEFIFVNDHSKDNSGPLLDSLTGQLAQPPNTVEVIHQPKNGGKGTALHTGFDRASGTIIGVQDADFEYDPSELPGLLGPLLSSQADAVYGSRFKRTGFQVHRTYHYLGNRFLTMLSNLLSGMYVTDMETCYKLFRAKFLKSMRLQSKRFGFEPEVTAYLAKIPCRVFELPVSYYPRVYAEGKKIGVKDGLAALYFLVRYNLLTSPKACFHRDLYEEILAEYRQRRNAGALFAPQRSIVKK